MKVQGAKKVHYDSGPNMTPLVDVVMVILIFLMLAGSFGGSSSFLMSKQGLKSTGGVARPLQPGEVPDVNLNVNIDNAADGVGFVAHVADIRTGSLETLKNALQAKRLAMNAAQTPDSQIQVVLFPSRRVKYQYLIGIYQAALEAKFQKVAFGTSH